MKLAVCPGSFDPVTNGHLDIIRRAAALADRVIVVVMTNASKHTMFTMEERVAMLRTATVDLPNVEIDAYDGLLADYARHVFIPILTVVILSIGARMRMTRTNMLEVLNSDYIRTARAKGLQESVVINKHAFRNTLIPLVTSMAGLLPSLFSGAIITEQVFDLPGIGNIALQAMNAGDIPFIMGYNMFLALLSVIGVLLSDLMYAVVDPRVKLE